LPQQAAEAWAAGQLVLLPTETIYGLAGAVSSDSAIDTLRRFKGYPGPQAFTVHLADPAEAEPLLPMTARLRWMLHRLMPGPVTVRVPVAIDALKNRLHALGLAASASDRLYDAEGCVGLRCPDHALARSMLGKAGGVIVATGAHPPGSPAPVEAATAQQQTGAVTPLMVDGGRCRFAKPSTIVRVDPDRGLAGLTVERVGVYDQRIIRRMVTWTVLFVCSGNTCRSPMAAGLARQMLAREHGVSEAALPEVGIEVRSAGVSAMAGAPASEPAVRAMRGEGVDLTHHRSQPVTAALVEQADVIYAMTEAHREAVLSLVPTAAGKTHRLDPQQDIGDPIGADEATYRQTADQMRQCLAACLKESMS
jgi:protein-tyrosine phosphatase